MAVWRGGFLKKCHQIAMALRVSNGGTMVAAIGLTVVAEWRLWRKKLFFFENFSKITDWVVLGCLDPTLNPVFESKWDEQHAARELLRLHEQHTPARAAGSRQHAPATTAPRTTHTSNGRQRQRLQTATATPWFCFFFCLTLFFNFWFCFFFLFDTLF